MGLELRLQGVRQRDSMFGGIIQQGGDFASQIMKVATKLKNVGQSGGMQPNMPPLLPSNPRPNVHVAYATSDSYQNRGYASNGRTIRRGRTRSESSEMFSLDSVPGLDTLLGSIG
ncbi:uncharacterized protein [Periplaneta americana]|uniref:uncharacterized protein n=1 Tax=Periplaneta americana TaxID=6978 RepID=UPI0037E9685A